MHTLYDSDDDSDDSDEETDSNVSENRVKPRRGRRKALADSGDTGQADEITTEIDPPSSPSELGKSKYGSIIFVLVVSDNFCQSSATERSVATVFVYVLKCRNMKSSNLFGPTCI